MHKRTSRNILSLALLLGWLPAGTGWAFECTNAGAVAADPPSDNDSSLSLACGDSAVAIDGGTALGWSSATNIFGTAVGYNSDASLNASAIGLASFAAAGSSNALGTYSRANNARSTAVGFRALVNKDDAVVLGPIAGVNGAGNNADVGIGTSIPMAPLHIFRDDPTKEFMFLESDEIGGPQDRAMMLLANNGGIRFEFKNASLGTAWRFQAATGNEDRFEITKVGTGEIEMTVDAAGNLEIQGTLTELSDRNAKQNIRPLENAAVLERLDEISVSEWAYKDDPDAKHMGPMAQDFHAAFGLGKDERHISARDMAGVNMAAVKALKARNQALDEEVSKLNERNLELHNRLELLEVMVAELLPQTAQN